jgi:hypothetical protein
LDRLKSHPCVELRGLAGYTTRYRSEGAAKLLTCASIRLRQHPRNRSWQMFGHRSFVVFLSLLVAGIHTHCVMAHGAELLQHVAAQKCSELPIGSDLPCENESSCICKGALVGASLAASCHADATCHGPSANADLDGSRDCLPLEANLDNLPEREPPPGGTAARARLQSFQL